MSKDCLRIGTLSTLTRLGYIWFLFASENIENICTNHDWIEEGEDPNHIPAGYTEHQIESVMAEYLPVTLWIK